VHASRAGRPGGRAHGKGGERGQVVHKGGMGVAARRRRARGCMVRVAVGPGGTQGGAPLPERRKRGQGGAYQGARGWVLPEHRRAGQGCTKVGWHCQSAGGWGQGGRIPWGAGAQRGGRGLEGLTACPLSPVPHDVCAERRERGRLLPTCSRRRGGRGCSKSQLAQRGRRVDEGMREGAHMRREEGKGDREQSRMPAYMLKMI